jgi:hypothetical protein
MSNTTVADSEGDFNAVVDMLMVLSSPPGLPVTAHPKLPIQHKKRLPPGFETFSLVHLRLSAPVERVLMTNGRTDVA